MIRVGIYALELAGETYVGASTDVQRRLAMHDQRLRAGKHECKALQALFAANGPPTPTLLEVIPIEARTYSAAERDLLKIRLNALERKWIREIGTLNTNGKKTKAAVA